MDAAPPERGRDAAIPPTARDTKARHEQMERERPDRDNDRIENDGRFGNYEAALQVKQNFDREVEQYRALNDGAYPPRYDRLLMKQEFDLEVAAYRAEHGEYPPGFEDKLGEIQRALRAAAAENGPRHEEDAPNRERHHENHDDGPRRDRDHEDTPTTPDADGDR